MSACSVQHCSRGAGLVIVLDIFGPNKAHSLPYLSDLQPPALKYLRRKDTWIIPRIMLVAVSLGAAAPCSIYLNTGQLLPFIFCKLGRLRPGSSLQSQDGEAAPVLTHSGGLLPPTSSEGHCSTCSNHCHGTVNCLQYMPLPGICIHAVVISLFINFCGVTLTLRLETIIFLTWAPTSNHSLYYASAGQPEHLRYGGPLPVVSRLQYPVL